MSDRFKVDLRGIIDLAANHLYTSPDVFVREMIQNAVDAISARQRIDLSHAGHIRLELTTPDNAPGTLAVVDNGIGLTLAEVHDFLSTVGGSSKREDIEEVAERLNDDAGGFLGRFGIGLLSCFMVTDEIVVVTRSSRSADAVGVEWRGRADGSYAVRELPESRVPCGTSVYLIAKPDSEEYFEKDRLLELARRYAEMLPIPIVVATSDDEIAINQERPPWMYAAEQEFELQEFCQHHLSFRPIDIFPVESPAGKVRGYAFIRPDRTTRWGGDHRLYARGMFVSGHLYGVIPEWATFVSTVLNSTGLRLTASRESVHQDAIVEATQEEIGAAVRARLVHLLRHDAERFAQVMAIHDTEIRGLAVKDRDFFDLIIDLLQFETSLGSIRFGEFRREHDRLFVARTGEQFRRLARIAGAAGLRIFNAGYTYHEELLARAAEAFPDLELRSFDSADLVDLMQPPDDATPFEPLLEAARLALHDRGCEPAVRSFMPADIPAFFALGLDAEFHRQLDRTKSMSSGIWQEVLEAMAPRPENPSPTRLCLNTSSTLVRRLAAIPDADLQRVGVEILYVQALMGGQHHVSGSEMQLMNSGMEKLLARVAEREATQ